MSITGDFSRGIRLAMAGKNPWGGGSDSDGAGGKGDAGDPQSDSPSDGGSAPDGGPSGTSDGAGPSEPSDGGPRNPWSSAGGEESGHRSPKVEDIFRARRGGSGGRGSGKGSGGGPAGGGFQFPTRPNGKSWLPIIAGGVAIIWLIMSCYHQVAPKEQGVVTTFGKYSRTLTPGPNITAPWPFQEVVIQDVTSIRSERIPGGNAEKLILTGDQNLVNLTYLIRWNIKDLKDYQFQLAKPAETVREAAEAAMRASVAEQELDSVMSGSGRAQIEQRVRERMQGVLDAYRSGVLVQGIEIEKTDPPEEVVEAFKDVSAAEQDANTDINRARAYEKQIQARAKGDAAEFDKIYEEYRRAPEVTRRRLYYETMESVLSQTDKTVVETGGVTTYLPLPEVKRRAAAPPVPPSAPPAPITNGPVTTANQGGN